MLLKNGKENGLKEDEFCPKCNTGVIFGYATICALCQPIVLRQEKTGLEALLDMKGDPPTDQDEGA